MALPGRYAKPVSVLAVDFLNLLVRAYHSGTKTETHAVRSMFQTVAAAVRELQPAAVVFALDGGHEHRSALLPTYKAHRPAPEPALTAQKELAEQAIAAAGFQSIRVPAFEADDVLASIARQRSGVVICSSDKDLLALCGVARVYHPWNGGAFVTAEERLGLPAGQVTDFLALCGDSSDGIPGVKGIGPKTAAALLSEFGDLEGILAAAVGGRIPGAAGKRLNEQRSDALKCRQIVALRDCLQLPELQPWRPPFDWQTRLQALRLGAVAAIVEGLSAHLSKTPRKESKPVLSAEPEQSEQNGREALQADNLQRETDHPSRECQPEFRLPVEPVAPVEPDRQQAAQEVPPPVGSSAIRVTRSISEPIRENLSYVQRWDGPDRGMIAVWESGRIAASDPEKRNPWKAQTCFWFAFEQGRQGLSLDAFWYPIESGTIREAEKPPRHVPPRSKSGSLF